MNNKLITLLRIKVIMLMGIYERKGHHLEDHSTVRDHTTHFAHLSLISFKPQLRGKQKIIISYSGCVRLHGNL